MLPLKARIKETSALGDGVITRKHDFYPNVEDRVHSSVGYNEPNRRRVCRDSRTSELHGFGTLQYGSRRETHTLLCSDRSG